MNAHLLGAAAVSLIAKKEVAALSLAVRKREVAAVSLIVRKKEVAAVSLITRKKEEAAVSLIVRKKEETAVSLAVRKKEVASEAVRSIAVVPKVGHQNIEVAQKDEKMENALEAPVVREAVAARSREKIHRDLDQALAPGLVPVPVARALKVKISVKRIWQDASWFKLVPSCYTFSFPCFSVYNTSRRLPR